MKNYILFLLVAVVTCGVFAGQPDDENVVSLDPGKLYRKVNDDEIFGRDILDLMMEQDWEKRLQIFVDFKLLSSEVATAGIVVEEADLNAEMQALINERAKQKGIKPEDVKLEVLAKGIGMETLRNTIRLNVGVLKALQKSGKVTKAKHTWESEFTQAVGEWLEKLGAQKGVERDPKNLGTGEAVRIGGRGYALAEVREFLLPQMKEITLFELKKNVEFLTLDKLVSRALKEKSLDIAKEDAEFHFSYLCRERELTSGMPGRQVLLHEIQQVGLTPKAFIQTRPFRCDAGLTMLAKLPVHANPKLLDAEFKAHPDRYQRKEKMVAHLLVRVLDSDGRPYSRNWSTPGHSAINAYVRKVREEQFTSTKPKIEGLVAIAKENFEAAARKYSEDRETAATDGKIGRIGKDTILAGSYDEVVRDAAMKLKPGEISEPVRSAFGWHLIKCLDNQDVSFDESSERVYLNLIKENRSKMHDSLMKPAKIEDK